MKIQLTGPALCALLAMGGGSAATSALAQVAGSAEPIQLAAAGSRAAKRRIAKEIEAGVPVQTPTERLTDDELALASRVYVGSMACDEGGDVVITSDQANPGFFRVSAGERSYFMHPVVSETGAIRLEDIVAKAMWLQLGNKSMLMDQGLGRRVADGCRGAEQASFSARMLSEPQKRLFGD